MLSYITYLKEWKNCFDFLSEPFSFAMLLDFSTEELRLVVKLYPNRLFVRQIIRDPLYCHLVDIYHETYLYGWIGSTVTRLILNEFLKNTLKNT